MYVLLIGWMLASVVWGQGLSVSEEAVIQAINSRAEESVTLLERLVNLNSGTFHVAGVNQVAAVIEPELKALGFETRLVDMGAVKRASHLVAQLRGSSGGKPLLLIGHMDTVFEPRSPFQRFVRNGMSATGPGVSDMKGGIVVMLAALRALHANGLLDGVAIEIFLTADEEDPGEPFTTSRSAFIEAGKRAKAALCFETGRRIGTQDYASTARRGFQGWELKVKGIEGHSGAIFSEKSGHGAIFELSRIVNQFHDQLREPNMTFNVGLILGGSSVAADVDGNAKASGKTNIVAGEALARGEVRALYPEQLGRVKDKMHAIVAKNLPGTTAELKFEESFPPMAPTPGNKRLLALLNEGNRRAGLPEVGELDPMERGAGDISFIAPFVDSISGLGAVGGGAHAPGENVDLGSIPRQAKRAALLIHSLTR